MKVASQRRRGAETVFSEETKKRKERDENVVISPLKPSFYPVYHLLPSVSFSSSWFLCGSSPPDFTPWAILTGVLLFFTWRGWRLGLVRAGMGLVGLLLGICMGWYLGAIVYSFSTSVLFSIGAAFILGVGIWVFIKMCTGMLFKRTEHQRVGVLRLFMGLGGAAVGLITGILMVWGGISFIRVSGAIAESRIESASRARQRVSFLAKEIAAVKESLENGQVGQVVSAIDPVPTHYYLLVQKIARVASSPRAIARLYEYKPIQDLMTRPKVVALVSDSNVNEAAATGNYLTLLSEPTVWQALNDPEFIDALQKIDLDKALDYALAKK